MQIHCIAYRDEPGFMIRESQRVSRLFWGGIAPRSIELLTLVVLLVSKWKTVLKVQCDLLRIQSIIFMDNLHSVITVYYELSNYPEAMKIKS